MSKKHNLRNRSSIDEVVVNEDEDENVANTEDTPDTPDTPVTPVDIILQKFGDKLKSELDVIVQSLKSDLAAQFATQLADQLRSRDEQIACLTDYGISRDIRISALETKVSLLEQTVRDANANFEKNLDTICDEVDRIADNHQKTPSSPPKIDTLIAGDSIIKHFGVDNLGEGYENELLCIPGARAHKVHRAILNHVKGAVPNDLVFHAGTNHIPQQTPDEVVTDLTSTLMQLQLDLPETKIHFSAILPKFDPYYNRGIRYINQRILALCKIHGMGFIHHRGFLHRNGDLNEKFFSPTEWWQWEPLHPSHDGVRALESDIKRHLDA